MSVENWYKGRLAVVATSPSDAEMKSLAPSLNKFFGDPVQLIVTGNFGINQEMAVYYRQRIGRGARIKELGALSPVTLGSTEDRESLLSEIYEATSGLSVVLFLSPTHLTQLLLSRVHKNVFRSQYPIVPGCAIGINDLGSQFEISREGVKQDLLMR